LAFGATIALSVYEISSTKFLEEKDHEAQSQAGKKGKDACSQEASKEGAIDEGRHYPVDG